MGSLSTALTSASNAMDVLEQAMAVTQNNVSNASTAGYVTQTFQLASSPFSPTQDEWGGVRADGVQSARDQFAEQAVWTANSSAGSATEQSTMLQSLEQQFNVSGSSGIPGALSALYSAFSSWSTTPTNSTAQQQVITAAQGVAQAFNQTAASVQTIRSQTDQQISSTVTQINQLTSQVAAINAQIRQGGMHDAGLQANLYNSLEQLSNLVPIQVQMENDGTATVTAGGQSALVIGQNAYSLKAAPASTVGQTNANAVPDTEILSADGNNVTGAFTTGGLGGLLQFRNQAIPSLIGDGTQPGSLNKLAQSLADTVNGLLTAGKTSAGAAGTPLFSYPANSATTVANDLTVVGTASGLAAANGSSANGTASALAGLASQTDPTLQASYSDYYASIASDIGTQASSASTAETTQSQVLAQAQNMRAQISGVSLNEQATLLLQYQQGYQAAAEVISVVNSTTQYLMQVMQQVQ